MMLLRAAWLTTGLTPSAGTLLLVLWGVRLPGDPVWGSHA